MNKKTLEKTKNLSIALVFMSVSICGFGLLMWLLLYLFNN